jgi:hypothetical protein
MIVDEEEDDVSDEHWFGLETGNDGDEGYDVGDGCNYNIG